MWNFNKLLGISGVHVSNCFVKGHEIYFQVNNRRKTADCPICNKRTDYLYGRCQLRQIKHGTVQGKICIFLMRLRRFRCRSCHKVFTEEVHFASKYQRVTIKHKREVIEHLSDRSFKAGTRRFKVSYGTQRKWLAELLTSEVFNFKKEEREGTTFVLGIDEVSFAGQDMITTIGNITKHRLKGVLRSRRKDELKKVLRSISPKVKPLITEVVIDMCNLYLRAVRETLPHVSIVVDHFHIIKDANQRIDEERRLLQDIFKKKIPRYIFVKNKEDLKGDEPQQLEDMMHKYPELTLFYQTKERLRDMYRSKNKQEATDTLRTIITSLTSTDDGELISWGRTLSYWKPYTLNYWNSRSTNGYMEGIHNKMKLIKRISFGFKNKEVFIHKVMLSVLISTILMQQL